MIYRDCNITISKSASTINDPIILYRGDREVELYFTIKESQYKFTDTNNLITITDASYAQIIIKVPNNNFPIFGEILPTKEGKVLLKITSDMIDEIDEIGLYDFQIRLYDESKTSRVTIPPIEKGIEVREPIAIEDASLSNEVGIATLGYAEIGTKTIQRPTLNEDGTYNKKAWINSEVITKEDLNVLEDISDKNTSEINLLKTSGGAGEGHTHTNKTTLDKITEEKLTSWDSKLDSIPSEYITESELNSKGYLTQHQDISMKVDKVTGKSLIADTEISRLAGIVNYVHPTTHLPSVIVQDSSNRFVTDTEKANWSAKSNFSGSYTDLTNKPTIPSEYSLPIATATTLGGIKVGAGLSITSGVLSVSSGGTADSVEWTNVQNKPSVFTPATHTHIKTDITDFSHTHTKTDITDFSHTHAIADLPTGTTSTTVSLGNHTHSGVYEPVITKNTAFNVNFETTATNIKMDGTQSLGSLSTVARADHIHPSDTTRVPTTRTVNNKALSSNITLTLDDIANGSTRSLDNYSLTTHNHDTNYSPLNHTHTNYDTAYTHSQSSHAPSTAQKNSDITKEEIEAKLTGTISSHSHSSNLVTTSIVGTTLTLTTDKYQSTTMVTGTTIVLPTVTSFTEIHLFFSASSDMTLTLPSCKWQSTPTISSGKYYEFIFTYTTEWLGGCVCYS